MNEDRDAFALRLRGQREHRGVTLKAIAESTKIKESLLAALERGDLSQWPQGLFRRAYIRNYATAIGLPAQSVVDEFNRLFPEQDACCDLSDIANREASKEKLHLHESTREESPVASRHHHVHSSAFDVGAVLMISGLLAGLSDLSVWTLTGVVALCYYTLGTAYFDQSIGRRVLGRTDRLFKHGSERRASTPPRRELVSIVQHKQPQTSLGREAAQHPRKTA